MIKKSLKTNIRMIVIFFLIFAVISSYLYFYIFNYSSNRTNFYENKSIHLIRIQGKTVNNVYKKMTKTNIEEIENILQRSREEYKLSPVFKLSSGIINADNDQGVVIYGIDETFTSMINDSFVMNDDILYSIEDIDKINLIVPHIEITSEGDIKSNTSEELTYAVKQVNKNLQEDSVLKSYFFSQTNNLPILFATDRTFRSILGTMFNDPDINSINKSIYDYMDAEEIILFIQNIHFMDSFANQLKANQFYITYAFDSFKNMSTDLFKSSILYQVVLIVIIILSSVYVVLSYKNHLKSQQKDMAVLKLFGYSEENIGMMYAVALYALLICVLVLIGIFNAIVSFNNMRTFLIIMAVEIVVLIVQAFVIKMSLIRRMVKKNILYLLKYDKEFE